MALHKRLKGSDAERVKEAFIAACGTWLDDRTWIDIWSKIVPALYKDRKLRPERVDAIVEWAIKGLTKEQEDDAHGRFGDEAVDACLSGSVVPAPPKPILPGDPSTGSYRKSKAQFLEAKKMLFAWIQEVEDDRVAQVELFSEYTKAQLAYTLAGLVQDTAKALPGRVLTGLERERLAELLVQVARVDVKKVDAIDVEALLGSDWAALIATYTARLEDPHRRNDEYAESWAANDEAEEAFNELGATGSGSGPRSTAKGY